ncbi:tryptophan synthase subunit alpha [Tautonia sociabilis]|uniref:Tryptophan synthase alpha chain n=1 Tax=Tautonia sociabilis TaxID=2080755 RepID=A0A432MNH7_9BACT|nr:tryptophan synthase subunit alpha [Tautonia sociabilis]RUL88870.1 tryptophan synthase subunit alpha [Tautonia sociabilis]
MNRIDALFERLRSEGRRALMPFLTAGDPDLPTTSALIREAIRRGAHMVEVGIPYSDPIADGPVIAASYQRALDGGIRLGPIFEALASVRRGGEGEAPVEAPMVTMSSYAIILRRGPERFADEAKAAGVDGLIVPDLPVEEAGELATLVADRDLRLIQLITPRTPRDRASAIARTTTGFIYYVSVAGITGERTELPPDLANAVSWLRTQTDLPICIGFGISRAEHIRALAPVADGLIVGSALVRRLAEAADQPRGALVDRIGSFIEELAGALPS